MTLKKYVDEAIRYIEENSLDDIHYLDIAMQLDISPSYAREVLKAIARKKKDEFVYSAGYLKRIKKTR